MLIYDHLRGVSVVSFPGTMKFAKFRVWETIRYLLHEGIKNRFCLFHHADGQKAYDKDICFFRNRMEKRK